MPLRLLPIQQTDLIQFVYLRLLQDTGLIETDKVTDKGLKYIRPVKEPALTSN